MLKRKKMGVKAQDLGENQEEWKKQGWILFFAGIPVNAEKELFIRFVLDFLSNTPISLSPNPPLDSCASRLLFGGSHLWGLNNCFYPQKQASNPTGKEVTLAWQRCANRTETSPGRLKESGTIRTEEPLTGTQ